MDREIDRQTDKQINRKRETDRQVDRLDRLARVIDRQTDGEINRITDKEIRIDSQRYADKKARTSAKYCIFKKTDRLIDSQREREKLTERQTDRDRQTGKY